MKKITTLFFLIWVFSANAQVRDYSFSQSLNTYQEIPNNAPDAVVLGSESSNDEYFIDSANIQGQTKIASGDGFPIGFNFVFNGTSYNQFGVSANGWISLGSTEFSPKVDLTVYGGSSSKTPLSSNVSNITDQACSRIAALANDLQAQTGASILYQVTGSSPNRTLVIQWKNYKKTTTGDGDSFNFQIRLNETSNTVQIVYGNFLTNSTQMTAQVGLRAAPATSLVNFNQKTSQNAWANSTVASSTSDTMVLNSTHMPSSGLTFTWSPNTCGGINKLNTTNITSSSASISWTAYTPTPDGFEYFYSKNSALPTGSGTPTSATTANISGLEPYTTYNVFLRTVCGNQYTSWFLAGTFKTKCVGQSSLFETFDSYTPNGTTVMPDCWDKLLISTSSSTNVYLNNTSFVNDPQGLAHSNPNWLAITARSTTNFSYALLPPLSNLRDDVNRIRFKAVATAPNQTLTLGYLTNETDPSSFTPLTTFTPPSTTSGTFQEFPYTPGSLPQGVTRLAFMVSGTSSTVIVYIDDVIWELKPTCTDNVSGITISNLTANSGKVNWTTPNTITKWQYVYSPTNPGIDPNNLTPKNVTGTLPTVTITNLQPFTAYNLWVRSMCDSSQGGSWIGPINFKTTCTPENMLFENFDSGDNLPDCWNKVGSTGTVSIDSNSPPYPPSFKNTLKLSGAGAMASIKPLTNTNTNTNRLKFKARTNTAGTVLEIGYLTDVNNPTTFVNLKTITIDSVNNFGQYGGYTFGNTPASNYLALKANKNDIYIDDVIWEPIPNCPDIQNISAVKVDSNSANLKWNTNGTETSWQYAMGSMTDINPYILQSKNFDSVNQGTSSVTGSILNLTPNTSYKIWIKPMCNQSSSGAYEGPYIIKTSCTPITDFSQNFDSSSTLPDCWSQSGFSGTVTVQSTAGITNLTTPPNLLRLTASTNDPAVVAIPAVSNASAGTYRLTFKYSSSNANVPLEVGYLKNIADNSTFVPLGNTFICSKNMQIGFAELGTEPATQVLAFRTSGTISGLVYLDDITWKPIPDCNDVTNFKATNVKNNSIEFAWTAGTQENQWQYVIGSASETNPDNLIPFEVTNGSPSAIATQLSANNPLQPNTTYKIWVRAKCSTMSIGAWTIPILATTTCNPVDSFYEDFSSGSFPPCWRSISKTGSISVKNKDWEPFEQKQLLLTYDGGSPVVALPAANMNSFAQNILKFKYSGTADLEVGYLANITDSDSFVTVQKFTPLSVKDYLIATVNFGNSPVSEIIAFRLVSNGGTFIDNVSWDKIPTAVPACTSVTASAAECGNPKITLNWNPSANADGYLVNVGTAPGIYDVISNKDLADALTTSFDGINEKPYYFTVTPYNYIGTAVCTEQNFTVQNNNCYCTSAPTYVDGYGVINVTIMDLQYETNSTIDKKITYKDFSDNPVNVIPGTMTNLKVKFFTTYGYKYFVWIDLNNDFNFDDSTEKLAIGITQPCVDSPFFSDASFLMPANAPLGKHRMRIAGRLDTQTPDPCYNSSFGVTLDFAVNIVNPPSNDEPSGATALQTGTSFDSNAITGTNINATGNYEIETPGCGNYFSSDVWYKAVVPASGKLSFEINSMAGGLTNTAGAVYSATADSLEILQCDDSSSTSGDDHPKIVVKGRTKGETLFFRVWDNGGDDFGSFKVSAYDNTTLGTDIFDLMHFAAYPNPVKDLLNISSDNEINSITVLNMLGQIMFSKAANETKIQLDLSGLKTGSYLVKINSENQSKTIKIIKE